MDRATDLGLFLGPVIGGIDEEIRWGADYTLGDFEAVTGQPNRSWDDFFAD